MDMSLSQVQELDRETWHAAVLGVTKSQTQMRDWTDWPEPPSSCFLMQSVMHHFFLGFISSQIMFPNKSREWKQMASQETDGKKTETRLRSLMKRTLLPTRYHVTDIERTPVSTNDENWHFSSNQSESMKSEQDARKRGDYFTKTTTTCDCPFEYAFDTESYLQESSTLAWKIPWTEDPGGLQSVGSLGVGHDWTTSLSLFTFLHWRRKWQPTPVFMPGESQGQGSLVGCHLWDRTESDTTEAT